MNLLLSVVTRNQTVPVNRLICELWIEAYINWAYQIMASEFQQKAFSKLLLSSFDAGSDDGSDHIPLSTALVRLSAEDNSFNDADERDYLPPPTEDNPGYPNYNPPANSALDTDSSPMDDGDLPPSPQPQRDIEATLESLSITPREMVWGPIPVESVEVLDHLLPFSPDVDVEGFLSVDNGQDNDDNSNQDVDDNSNPEDRKEGQTVDNLFSEIAEVALTDISCKINYVYLKMILAMTTCKDKLGYFDQTQLESMVSKVITRSDSLLAIEWESRGEMPEPSLKYSSVLKMGAKVFNGQQVADWQLPIRYRCFD